ncbi:MAG TPA: hypothetical protein VFG20_05595 [Planctomycetaceae bacterium]|nr:hypothetical protein [Planctomycetaceae bacterium]
MVRCLSLRIGRPVVSLLATSCCAAALALTTTVAHAQPRTSPASYTRDQARQSIEDLSNGMMDDFSVRRTPSGSWKGNPTPDTKQLTAEMRAVRPIIKDFADEVPQLSYLLTDEAKRVANVRPLIVDANRIAALAIRLDKQAQRLNDHRQLGDDFEEFDAAWRELAYRLEATRGLTKDVRDEIATLSDLETQIREAIGMRPQINRRDLAAKTGQLANDLKNLSDDIRDELRGREAQQYQLSLGRARQQALNLSALVDDPASDMEELSAEYRKFQELWYPQRTKLQEFDNRYFERSLRRITQSEGEIHQLLLLPSKIDSTQLVYLTSALKKDIDQFFDRMSLKLLMHLKHADRVAGVASEFYGVNEHFVDVVKTGADHDELVDSYHYIEQAERNFSAVFSDIDSDDALAALSQIQQTIVSLGEALQIQSSDLNRRQAAELAANVEALTDELEYAAKRWLNRDRQQFSRQCLEAIAQLREETLQLHQDLVAGVATSNLRREVDSIYNLWRETYGYLVKCQTEDRPALGRVSSRLTPALVELRTMLAQ